MAKLVLMLFVTGVIGGKISKLNPLDPTAGWDVKRTPATTEWIENLAFELSDRTGPTYSVISSTHFCGHVDGGFPARCWTVNFTGACEDQCTAFDSCIAYASDAKQCFIIPSTGSCPSGWKFENGHIAKQRIDLTTSDAAFYGCIAKETTTTEAPTTTASGDAGYTFIGTGCAGPNEIWSLGNAKGQGVRACYEAVKLDRRCTNDYFTYVTRGDKNCGCKGSGDALSIRQDNNADYFKIEECTNEIPPSCPLADRNSCSTLAGKNLCGRSWNALIEDGAYFCQSYTNGLVKDNCRLACGNCDDVEKDCKDVLEAAECQQISSLGLCDLRRNDDGTNYGFGWLCVSTCGLQSDCKNLIGG